jgi:hypothetical protein
MRQPNCRCNCFIEDAQVVVLLKRRLDAAQHGAGNLFVGSSTLTTWNLLASAGILLEVLLVLRPGGCGDGAQFAAGKRGLQQIGGIVLSRLSARADHGVRFIDEENDFFG